MKTTTVTTMTEEVKPRMLTLRQCSELIEGLSEYRVRQACITGDLKHTRAGRKYLVSEKNLLEFFGC